MNITKEILNEYHYQLIQLNDDFLWIKKGNNLAKNSFYQALGAVEVLEKLYNFPSKISKEIQDYILPF